MTVCAVVRRFDVMLRTEVAGSVELRGLLGMACESTKLQPGIGYIAHFLQ